MGGRRFVSVLSLDIAERGEDGAMEGVRSGPLGSGLG